VAYPLTERVKEFANHPELDLTALLIDFLVMTIYFYRARDAYGCFSNFSAHGFSLDGLWWPTSEHYFQAQKFVETPQFETVRLAPSPKEAADLGRDRSFPLRSDWNAVKDDIMTRAVLRKFEIHRDIRRILLDTGTEAIAEDAPGDYYWGCGTDRTGQNKLGIILMNVREQLGKLQ
jgi:N-glycosidase YbiA